MLSVPNHLDPSVFSGNYWAAVFTFTLRTGAVFSSVQHKKQHCSIQCRCSPCCLKMDPWQMHVLSWSCLFNPREKMCVTGFGFILISVLQSSRAFLQVCFPNGEQLYLSSPIFHFYPYNHHVRKVRLIVSRSTSKLPWQSGNWNLHLPAPSLIL